MALSAIQTDIAERLQKDILSLQGFRAPSQGKRIDFGLGAIETAFPNHIFPTGAVHEFVSSNAENAAATTGFLAGLLGKLMGQYGICLWIGIKPHVFPPALKTFGIEPDRVVFIDLSREKDVVWAMEEALKCNALAAVVGELNNISFTESRRLQLAVEQSRVTGFLHRNNPKMVNTLACVSRWQITPLISQLEEGMPGVGYPRWHVALQKIRNGEPGEWILEWISGRFELVTQETVTLMGRHDLLNIA